MLIPMKAELIPTAISVAFQRAVKNESIAMNFYLHQLTKL